MSQKSARHYATDWVFKHSNVTGIVRYIFVAIAQFMKGGKCETPPTAVEDIRELTGLGESTIRRGIKEIEKAGDILVVKANRRGTVHKYVLAQEVRLPLDVDPPHRSERAVSLVTASGVHDASSPPLASGVSGHSELSAAQCSVGAVSASGALVQQASNSDLCTSTEELTTTNSSTSDRAIEEFLAWFSTEYPNHRHGIRYTVQAADFGAARDLLTGRSMERARAMAVELWNETADAWVLRGDRSPRVLKTCAATYEARVLAGHERMLARLSPFEQAKRAGLK